MIEDDESMIGQKSATKKAQGPKYIPMVLCEFVEENAEKEKQNRKEENVL